MSQKLSNHIANGYSVKIGEYLSRGWELFKANMGSHIGFFVVFLILATICKFIPIIGTFTSVFLAPMVYGIYLVNRNFLVNKKAPEFGDYFKGYDYTGKIILMALISLVLSIVILLISAGSIILPMLTGGGMDDIEGMVEIFKSKWIFLVLGFILIIFVSLIIEVATFIAVFHKEDIGKAIEKGFKFVLKNPFGLIGFGIINSLITIMGIFGLIIGIIFTMPWGMCNNYAMYEDLIGIPEYEGLSSDNDLIDSIGAN